MKLLILTPLFVMPEAIGYPVSLSAQAGRRK